MLRRFGLDCLLSCNDACRSPAKDALTKLGGSSAFNTRIKTVGHVDIFYACPSDESAYEIPRENQAFFTEILLSLLKAPPAAMLETAEIRKQKLSVIPSSRLEAFLYAEVPKRAAGNQPPFDQSPDIETPSRLPEFFAVAGPLQQWMPGVGPAPHTRVGTGSLEAFPQVEQSKIAGGEAPQLPAAPLTGSSELVQWHAKRVFDESGVPLPDADQIPDSLRKLEQRSGFDHATAAMRQAKGRSGFETRVGFTIIDAAIARVTASNNTPCHFEHDWELPNVTHIRIGNAPWSVQAGTALIEFADNGGVALAIMPGYIGTVVVHDASVAALNYAPSAGTALFEGYKYEEERLQARRELAAAAATVSKLHELAKSEGAALAQHIRVMKGYHPSLGILAAYAYYLADDPFNVQDVFRWMVQTRVNDWNEPREILAPVPFDVAMLAGKLLPGTPPVLSDLPVPGKPVGVAPAGPMLTLGRSLLDTLGVTLPPSVLEAGSHRRPGTWVAFDQDGVRLLREAIQKGEI